MFSSKGIPYARVTRFHRCSLTQLKGLIDRPLTSEYVSLKKIDKLLSQASAKVNPISLKRSVNYDNTPVRKLSKNTFKESTSRRTLKPQKKSSMEDTK